MSTKIEWADETWNPLLGCERVSAGCDRCYAITTATIRAGNPNPKVAAAFAGLTERRDGRLDWTGRINLLPERLTQPLDWKKPRRIFVNSQSDLFHKDVPDEFIAQVFAVMALTPQHTYQLLTKRHARMRSLLNAPDFQGYVSGAAIAMASDQPGRWHPGNAGMWPLPNLWLGVSVENQQWADVRIPALLDTPAAVRWLSMEPLLGPVELPEFVIAGDPDCLCETGAECPPNIDWVVVGGETGAKSRPMKLAWARSLRDQCISGGIPFFFKQWGDWVPVSQMPEDTFVDCDAAHGGDQADRDVPWRMGKKRAGRLLDEREWDEFPAGRAAVTA